MSLLKTLLVDLLPEWGKHIVFWGLPWLEKGLGVLPLSYTNVANSGTVVVDDFRFGLARLAKKGGSRVMRRPYVAVTSESTRRGSLPVW